MSLTQLDLIITHLLQTVSPHLLEQFGFKQLPAPLDKTIAKLPRHEKQILLLALLKYMLKNPGSTEQQLKQIPKSTAQFIAEMLEHDPKEYIYRQMMDGDNDD